MGNWETKHGIGILQGIGIGEEDGGVDRDLTAPGWIAHIASDLLRRRPPLVQVHNPISAPAQFAGQFREPGPREAPPGGFCRGYVARIRGGARRGACDPGCGCYNAKAVPVIRRRPTHEGVGVG